MRIVLCHPNLTLQQEDNREQAMIFYESCKEELDAFLPDVHYLINPFNVCYFMNSYESDGVVIAFFNPSCGQVDASVNRLLTQCNSGIATVWPIAMEKKNRMPPEVVKSCQSFDISVQLENRQLSGDSIRTIAFIFARKLISQAIPSFICDCSRYFISHKRSDGEGIAWKLADKINLLARERRCYRDVVEVKVGRNAQNEIDDALKYSDLLILLQTPEAGESGYIRKEVIYALLHDIPVLWIQIDGAAKAGFEFVPLESPHMKYAVSDFEDEGKLEKIADDVERKGFHLIMNSCGSVYNYVDMLKGLKDIYPIKITNDRNHTLAYSLDYRLGRPMLYMESQVRQYIQCYGRNPRVEDKIRLQERSAGIISEPVSSVIMLYRGVDNQSLGDKFYEANYEDYLIDLEKKLSGKMQSSNRSIVISGAFPDYDEIYKSSLSAALISYAKEIIQRGFTLIFGSHPTFQKILFEIGKKYSFDPTKSIHMYMAEDYADGYDMKELKREASVYVSPKGSNISESLTIMRRKMIQESHASALICLGGRVKEDKSQQGIDEEISIAREVGIPVFLSGSVGGRSSELAAELKREGRWQEINDAEPELNESLLCSLNHRKMAHKILEYISAD